ncbi:hypothetical protein GWK47_050952 [Chionoecetes opilio]|uniref:Uncharacterized protein n=1 Tax=Chionoecetes opilio TaxID=41210 RepID=A0A8J4YD95_CHIOP|nr:hypothetical protein GWK47_050952 [Chionoecetes opilio]
MREGGAGLEDTDRRSQEEDVMWTTNYETKKLAENWNRGRRAWYETVKDELVRLGMRPSRYDPAMFVFKEAISATRLMTGPLLLQRPSGKLGSAGFPKDTLSTVLEDEGIRSEKHQGVSSEALGSSPVSTKHSTQQSPETRDGGVTQQVKEEPLYVTRAHDTQEMRKGGAGLEDTDMRSQEEDVMWTTNYGNQGNYGRNWNRGRRVKGMVDQGNSVDSDMKEYEKYKETNETESQPQQSQENESGDDDDTNAEDNGKEVTARVDEPERKTTAPKVRKSQEECYLIATRQPRTESNRAFMASTSFEELRMF